MSPLSFKLAEQFIWNLGYFFFFLITFTVTLKLSKKLPEVVLVTQLGCLCQSLVKPVKQQQKKTRL